MNLWGWWKSHTFGGKILRDLGSVQVESGKSYNLELKVLELEPKQDNPGPRIFTSNHLQSIAGISKYAYSLVSRRNTKINRSSSSSYTPSA